MITEKQKEQARVDIIKIYKDLMTTQKELNSNSLCAGGNLGKIISAYLLLAYGDMSQDQLKELIGEIK